MDSSSQDVEQKQQQQQQEEELDFSFHEEERTCIPPGENGIGGFLSHCGNFAFYNIYGNEFVLTAKYQPPLRPISKGAYGIVCAAFDSESNEEIAVKKIGAVFDNKVDAKRILREIKLLRHLDHENIIAIRDIIPPPSRQHFNDVYIVTELMDTDLHHIIHSNQPLTEEHCQYFLYQVLRGLKYIHSSNVLHRDLKPSNLLVNANCDLKICDFGLARTTSETDFMTEYVVTRWYRAPELLLNASDYTAAIDMWSVGCIYMELLNRKPLLPGKDYVHQLRSIIELIGLPNDSELGFVKSENARKYLQHLPRHTTQPLADKFPEVSPLAMDLIQKMLTFDPSKRITAEEALAHPYLANLHDETDEPTCLAPFVVEFDELSLSEHNIKDLIYEESMKFYPELRS